MAAARNGSGGRRRRQLDPDIAELIGETVQNSVNSLLRQERERRDPRVRQARLFDRLESFLDGVESAIEDEGPPQGRGRGRGEDDDQDDDEDEDAGSIFDLFTSSSGGGGRRR